jgi:hypothetical protein
VPGSDIAEPTRAAEPQHAIPAEPIYRCNHLRPRIGRQSLRQLIKGAGSTAATVYR